MKKASRREGRTKRDDYRDPSPESLREFPEVDESQGTWVKNPYAARIAREGMELPDGRVIRSARGRPPKGEEVGPSAARSIRFPDAVWKQVEKSATERGMTVHAAVRTAVLAWLGRA